MTDTIKTMAYAGRRVSTENKALYAYAEAGEDGLSYYGKPLVTGLTVGTEIEVTFSEGTKIYVRGEHAPRITGQTDDDAAVSAWSAADKAAQVQLAQVALNNKRKRAAVDPLQGHLEELRAATRGMNTSARAAFAQYVSTYIQG